MESLNPGNRGKQIDGFTLVEMMIVLVIVGIIMAMSIGGLPRIAIATELTGTGEQIVSHLTQARQTAIADSAHVELRVYQPLESDTGSWGLVLARQNSDGSYIGLLPPYYLSASTSVSQSSVLSTIISELELKQDTDLLIKAEDPDTQLSYTSFRFHPDGSTDLPVNATGDTWHMTIIITGSADPDSDAPPKNFYTIRIDPFTGAIRTFRP